MFDQLLGQQVANNSFIKPADGVDFVLNSGFDINSNGDIIIKTKKKILEKLKKYYTENIFQGDELTFSQENIRVAIY